MSNRSPDAIVEPPTTPIRQAVILAGGLGTRLRPIIGDLPKGLAPVGGRPFLEYQLAMLRSQGFQRIVLCTGYRHDLIQAHFGNGDAWGVHITYSVEREPLGTAGALRQARPGLDGSFLTMNGDTYFGADLSQLVLAHGRGGTRHGHEVAARDLVATLALLRMPDASRYGAVTLDADGYVVRFAEKSGGGPGLISAGLYVFSMSVFDHFPPRTPLSLETDVFPLLASRRLLGGLPVQGYHLDIGVPGSYQRFQEDVSTVLLPYV